MMNRMKFSHFVSKKKQGKPMSLVDAYSPERARGYAEKLFQMVVKGWGDAPLALEDCAKRSRMSERSYERLMKGETKDPKLTVFGRVRAAYLDYCEEQVARLQHEIHIEKARNPDGDLENLDLEASALAEKIRQAKNKGR